MNNRRLPALAITLITVFNCLTVNGQERKGTFGAKVGLNNSRVKATERDGTRSGYVGTEIYGGFFVDTRLTSKLDLGSELLVSYTDDYHFIELPLNLKYKFAEKWNVFAGPKLDYIVDESDEFYRFMKLGVSAEVGSQFHINRLFFAELRYAKSFTPQIDSDFLEFYNGKRNTFRLGIGMNFRKAQPKIDKLGAMRLRTGISVGAATTSGYDVVAGADFRIQKDIADRIALMLSAGYSHYSLSTEGLEETNIAYFPLKIGGKIFPVDKFYFAPEAGVAVGTKSEAYTYPFIYAAGVGLQAGKGFDISLRYEKMTGHIEDYLNEINRPGQLALRLEYGFNLNPQKKK
jgi:hypothetical protein